MDICNYSDLKSKKINKSKAQFKNSATRVKEILDTELEKFHSLKSLAERSFTSPVYLSRSFKKEFGINISIYQLNIKLNKALKLLNKNTLSVKDIAYSFGFYDDSHFIKSFKKKYGLSPRKYLINYLKTNQND